MTDPVLQKRTSGPPTPGRVTVVGAGVFGLWQALECARAGWQTELIEATAQPFAAAASRYAGAMIAPYCEAESAPPVVRDLGLRAAKLWRARFPDLVQNGSLVVAQPRDLGELRRFARMTTGHQTVDSAGLAELEPDLADRFATALYFPDEAHLATPMALRKLLQLAQAAGARAHFGTRWDGSVPFAAQGDSDQSAAGKPKEPVEHWLIDCRGLAARDEVADLRGVRGERVLLRSHEISLSRPVRLLHPRQPLYVVPWPNGEFLVGATVIESQSTKAVTVRSALELLGLAYALHPAFAEAEILDLGAGLRPSLPDNVPRASVDPARKMIQVNGAYRHGFLLAPVLAEAVCARLAAAGPQEHPLLREETSHASA